MTSVRSFGTLKIPGSATGMVRLYELYNEFNCFQFVSFSSRWRFAAVVAVDGSDFSSPQAMSLFALHVLKPREHEGFLCMYRSGDLRD